MSEVESFKKHQKVIEENRDLLLMADEIRKSEEFVKAMHYFNMQARRGNVRERPSLKNKYRIVV